MAVIVEAFSIVIRNSTIEERYPGGLEAYRGACPNGTFCTDGEICRVGFMIKEDVKDYLLSLANKGVHIIEDDRHPQVAVIDQDQGLEWPCGWLRVGRYDDMMVAMLVGSTMDILVAPPGWEAGREFTRVSREELERDFEYLGKEGSVLVYRNKVTGEKVYVGRPSKRH